MEAFANQIQSATIEATVIRADGTVEHLGVVDAYKRPWWRTFAHKLTRRS